MVRATATASFNDGSAGRDPAGRGSAGRSFHGPIVVVAPHPDDDAIGCGGAIARTVAAGSRVHVIYVTDGSASHPRSKRFPPATLRARREREARAGLAVLGVTTEPVFLGVPDGTTALLDTGDRERVAGELAAVLRASGATVVYGPWPRDPHPDHAATAALLRAALGRLETPPAFLAYPVWLDEFGAASDRPSPGHPMVELRLTARERALKRAAIVAHESQATGLIDDDPEGFRIAPEVLARWLRPIERFYVIDPAEAGTSRR